MAVFRFAICVFGLVCFLAGYPAGAQAQNLTEQFNKPMPEFEPMPEADFMEASEEISQLFTGNKALDFKMRVPKDWIEADKVGVGDIKISNKILGEIKKYYGPPAMSSVRSYLTVEAEGLEFKMTTEQWFVQYLLSNGYNAQGMMNYGKNHSEAVYVFLQGSESYVVRAKARINGNRIVLVQYFVPLERWHDEKAMAARILESFTLLNSVENKIEDMQQYQFLDIAEFSYPVSWRLKALPVRSVDKMSVRLINSVMIDAGYGNMKERLDGEIDVDLISIYVTEALEDEIEAFKERMAEKNVLIGELIETRDDFLLSEDFDFVETQVFKAIDQSSEARDFEVWLTVMAAEDYYYFVSLVTQSRNQDYFLWARNSETYKLVVSQMKPRRGGGGSP